MGLRFKFNVAIFITLSFGMTVVYWIYSKDVHIQNAMNLEHKAALVFQAAESIRRYNNQEVIPLIEQLNAEFLPQSVGSYAATQIFVDLQQGLPHIRYKVAIDASDVPIYQPNIWQKKLIETFRSKPQLPMLSQQLADAEGAFFVYAKPIMSNNSISGAKIVRINVAHSDQLINQSLNQYLWLLVILLLVIMLVLNVMMHWLVIKPLQNMAEQAEQISQGQSEADEIDVYGHDELSQIGFAFNRLQRSLKAAMSMLS